MKIAIMGVGGLGGYLGGWLAHTGQDVTFLARGERLRVMREQGLHVRGMDKNFVVTPVTVTDEPAAVGQVDLILFCVKTYDVIEAAALIAPMVSAQTAVLPVQNGVRHVEHLQTALGAEAVLGGMTTIGVHSTTPGLVESKVPGKLLKFGELNGNLSLRCQQIEAVLKGAGFDASVIPNIVEQMWWKFVSICGAGVFAVLRGSGDQIRRTPEVCDLVRQTVAEGVAVAQSKGVPLADSQPEDVLKIFQNLPSQWQPSMLVDLEQGRRLEVEAWNGTISQMGKEMGIPTPANDFIYACLKPYMHGRL